MKKYYLPPMPAEDALRVLVAAKTLDLDPLAVYQQALRRGLLEMIDLSVEVDKRARLNAPLN